MTRKTDPLARARRALRQVDDELDPHRAAAHARARVPDAFDDAAAHGAGSVSFEIARGEPRRAPARRAHVAWALAVSVLLLGGVGLGTAALWPAPEGSLPGGPAPTSPSPAPTTPRPAPTSPSPVPDDTPAEPTDGTTWSSGGEAPSPGPTECVPVAPAHPTPEATHEATRAPAGAPTDAC